MRDILIQHRPVIRYRIGYMNNIQDRAISQQKIPKFRLIRTRFGNLGCNSREWDDNVNREGVPRAIEQGTSAGRREGATQLSGYGC
jgi:hypothetical protein